MRFIFKCIVTLTILCRAIIASQDGSETAALSADLKDAASTAQARARDEIATRIGAYCRTDPTTCLDEASRLTGSSRPAPAVRSSRDIPGMVRSPPPRAR